MSFDFEVVSDIGTTRETNQDSVCIHSADTLVGEVIFGAVCDGMGGLTNGEFASQSMIQKLEQWFYTELPILISEGIEQNKLKSSLENILVQQNEVLIHIGNAKESPMGTTISAILILPGRYFGIHVGDSRIYEIKKRQILQVTNDHSRVMQEVRLGIITPTQAQRDERKNELLQCIGVRGKIVPEFFEGVVKQDTTFVLCSDGFVHKICNKDIWKNLRPNKTRKTGVLSRKLKQLVEINKARLETDNITALAIRVTGK